MKKKCRVTWHRPSPSPPFKFYTKSISILQLNQAKHKLSCAEFFLLCEKETTFNTDYIQSFYLSKIQIIAIKYECIISLIGYSGICFGGHTWEKPGNVHEPVLMMQVSCPFYKLKGELFIGILWTNLIFLDFTFNIITCSSYPKFSHSLSKLSPNLFC